VRKGVGYISFPRLVGFKRTQNKLLATAQISVKAEILGEGISNEGECN
jgi:hypothetical protein